MHTVLTDDDVRGVLDWPTAVAAVRDAVEEHGRGTLSAPPRWSADAGDGDLVFTVGVAARRGVVGFRVYETFPEDSDEHTQLVAVWRTDDGRFGGVALGYAIGAMRTGAVGGVAADELAREDASRMGVLGSGRQAAVGLRAVAAVRDLDEVRVFSPTKGNRESFAADAATDLAGVDVTAVDDTETAVLDADVLLCATTSDEPVFDADWLAPDAHVTTVGPKFEGAHELPLEVASRADVVATDSRAQVDGYADYRRPFFLDDADRESMVELGELVTGAERGRRSDEDLTLFCSVGLAGTEVVLADEAFRRHAGSR